MSNIIEFNDPLFKSSLNTNIISNNRKLKNDLLLSNNNSNDFNNENFIQNKTIALKDFRKYIVHLNDRNYLKDIEILSNKFIQKIKDNYENKYKYILEKNPNTNSDDYKNAIKSLNKSIKNKISNLKFINEYNQKIIKNIDNKIYIDNNIVIKDFIFDNSFLSKKFLWKKIIQYYFYYFKMNGITLEKQLSYSVLYRLYTYLILNKLKFNNNASGGNYYNKNNRKNKYSNNKKNKSFNYVNINSLLTFKDLNKPIPEFVKNKNFWFIDEFFDSLKFKSPEKKINKKKQPGGGYSNSFKSKYNSSKNNNNSFILKIYKELIDKTNNFTNSNENMFYDLIYKKDNSTPSMNFLELTIKNEEYNEQTKINFGLNYLDNQYINKHFYSLIFILKDFLNQPNLTSTTIPTTNINISINEFISFIDYYKKTVFNSYFDPINNKLNEFYKFIETNINKENLKNSLLNDFSKHNNINAFTEFYEKLTDKDKIFKVEQTKPGSSKKITKKIPDEYRKILLYLYLLKNNNNKEYEINSEKYIIKFDEDSEKNLNYIATIICYLEFLYKKNKLLIDLLRIQYNLKTKYNHEEPISIMINYIDFIHNFNLFTYTKLDMEFNNFCIDCNSNKKKINNILSNNLQNSNISSINDIFNSNSISKNTSNFKSKIQNKINKLREKYKGTNKEKIINKIEQNYLSKFEGL